MKFFHLSDLHLGLSVKGHSLEEDQRAVLEQVVGHAVRQRPEAIVLAGDIFDKADPPAGAIRLFDWFVSALHQKMPDSEVLIVSGNHDNGDRLALHQQILAGERIHISGSPPRDADERIRCVRVADRSDPDGVLGPVCFYMLPFVKPSMVAAHVGKAPDGRNLSYEQTIRALLEREEIDPKARNIIVSHQYYVPDGNRDGLDSERMGSELPVVGNLDAVGASVLKDFDYAALGHLHKPMAGGSELCRYCGTPMQYSMSEAGQEKGIVVVEMGAKGDVRTSVIPLRAPHGFREVRGTYEDVLAMPDEECQDYTRVVLTGDQEVPVLDLTYNMKCKFPRLLEVDRERRPGEAAPDESEFSNLDEKSVEQICLEFLGGSVTDAQLEILREIISEVQGGEMA